MDLDYRRSVERVAKSEAHRGKPGFGFTGQARSAIVDRYLTDLSEWIGTSLADKRRSRDVRRAVRGLNNGEIAHQLLIAGTSVAMGKRFGVDEDENKNRRDTAVWIGHNFVCETRAAACRAGEWGIRGLLTLPIFKLLDDEILVIVATDEIQAAMDGFVRSAAAHHPLLSPQERSPVLWNGFRSGGLPPDCFHKPQLVRTNHKSIEDITRRAIATGAMQPVLDAINALQSVPLAINRPILDLVRRCGPPSAPDDQLLKSDDAKSKQLVREMTAAIHNWNFDMAVADPLAELDRCYIPLTLDTRGRLVPIPWLSFIREDRVRSLFLFDTGEPINGGGLQWLKQFVARLADENTFSDEPKPSRLDFDGRIAWTERNLPKIMDIGAAVLRGDTPDLNGIDDKFQFAAACTELTEAIEALCNGRDFITRLPIQFDASCSGLQHLCAMSRADEGKYVNLGPSLQKHYETDISGNVVNLGSPDIYTLVQAEVYLDHPEFGDLVHPLERRLAKTPTMTKFYGCGTKKMAKQINDALLEPTEQATDLAKAVRATIKKIAPKAIEVFEWLQELGTICAEHKVLLRWPTKLGLPVINAYHHSDTKQIKRPVLKDGKQVIRDGKPVFRYTELADGYKDSIKIGKAITAAAANFVHSADACHLQMIALACEKEVIPLVTVHDCFATTANHAGRLHEIIREQFVDIYENYDWLGAIWRSARDALPKSVELPPIPERGKLNIKDVLNNFHAFS